MLKLHCIVPLSVTLNSALIYSRDVGVENNVYGVAVVRDETVFPVTKVECVGQIIGAIIAKDHDTAQEAARKV